MGIIKLLKNWTLPCAMAFGTVMYLIFGLIPELSPVADICGPTVVVLMPVTLFLMLYVTFCKMKISDMKPEQWHWWLIIYQIVSTAVIVGLALLAGTKDMKVLCEGVLASVICPAATAGPVITGKLGGNAASLTTYTLISNIITALLVPVFFPMVEKEADITFMAAFLKILNMVVLVLIVPLVLAWATRKWFHRLHGWVCAQKDLAFYLWGFSLSMVMGQTVKSIVHADVSVGIMLWIALAITVLCVFQFAFGKTLGGRFGRRITAGQAVGQRNTSFAIWMAVTYLNPVSAVGPGCYVIAQNIINSWQLWRVRNDKKI